MKDSLANLMLRSLRAHRWLSLELYQKYREGMGPILATYGGGFRYDFTVDKTLKSETTEPINRVFAIYFKDKDSMDKFFSNPQYLEVKNKYYMEAVVARTIISQYER